ncbi:Aldo/keto reductase [Thozetella sp. PMI_491]|nr:Aldo/keto reductase [Thozetella sp. PMI_491]
MAQIGKLTSRPLGKNGPLVPRLGLGLMGTSGHYRMAKSDEERIAFLDKAYEMGETFWDSADMYGDCEDLLGKWFAANPEKRKDIFLTTKFGIRHGEGAMGVDSSPEYCRAALEKSLKRLGLLYVDLFYIHHLDKVTPIENTIQAMVELKNEGKLKYIGICECSATTLRRAQAVHPITAVQTEYNLFTLEVESPERLLLQTARELSIAFVAYSPLARGILTAAFRAKEDVTQPGDMRSMLPRYTGDNFGKNVAIADKISEMAKAKGATAAQLALAWLLAQGDDVFGIPGTSSAERLAENVGAMDIQVTAEEEAELREIAKGVAGGRLPDSFAGINLFADTPALDS